jgi:hypothetical protein
MTNQPMTTAGLQAKVWLRRAWFEAHPNQPMPEGRAQVEALFSAIEAEARLSDRQELLRGHEAHEVDRLTRGRALTDDEIACYIADHQTPIRHGTARVGDEIAEQLRDRLTASAGGPPRPTVTRPTEEEVRAALVMANVFGIVADRLAVDLFTQSPDTDHSLDSVGCIFDSGAGRCDGAYQHINKLHYSIARNELWESPW